MGRFRRVYHKLRRTLFPVDAVEAARKAGAIIGKNFQMMHDCLLDEGHCWLIEIGDDVTFAPRVHILAHDASTRWPLGKTRIARVTIGNRVFVGALSIVLPGVTIGDDVIVGAGSVVTKSVPSGCVVAGNPARVIGKTEELLARRRAEMGATPNYDESWTIRRGIPFAKRVRQREMLGDGFGYVV